jgi:plasmid stabilization system protein ParE
MTRRTIRWLAKALDDLDQQAQWLSGVEGADPVWTMARMREAVRSMQRLGDSGRPGRAAGTRQLS